MRRTLLLVALLAGAAGCPDQGATNQAQSAREIDQALENLRDAGKGFVPPDAAKPGQPVTVAEHRQDVLQKNVQVLESAAASGQPQQRVAARRMLADVHSSAARHEARTGAVEAAALANRAATLYGYLIAVDRADGRAVNFNTDFSAVMKKLDDESAAAAQDRQQAQMQVDDLSPKAQALEQKVAKLQADSAALRGQAEAMRREAFNLEGEARYDQLNQADEIQKSGDALDFEAQRTTVDLEQTRTELADAQRSLAAAEQKVKLIQQVQQQTQQRQDDTKQLREEADTDKAEAIKELMIEFKQVAQAYDTAVVTTFENALKTQQKAIEQLDRAMADASGEDAQVIKADLVGKLLDRVYVISEYASAAGEFGRTVDSLLVRADSLMPGEADAIAAQRRQIADRQARLIQDASDAGKRARDLIGELRQSAPDGSDMAQGLARQQEALEQYARQLEQATLEQGA